MAFEENLFCTKKAPRECLSAEPFSGCGGLECQLDMLVVQWAISYLWMLACPDRPEVFLEEDAGTKQTAGVGLAAGTNHVEAGL